MSVRSVFFSTEQVCYAICIFCVYVSFFCIYCNILIRAPFTLNSANVRCAGPTSKSCARDEFSVRLTLCFISSIKKSIRIVKSILRSNSCYCSASPVDLSFKLLNWHAKDSKFDLRSDS